MATAYGQILTTPDDLEGVRQMLNFGADELGDEVLTHPWVLGAAERYVMRQVPQWALILQLGSPPAPALAAVTPSSASQLLAATYFAVLVAKVGATPSPPGAEASQAIVAGQQLQVTAPTAPGINLYDLYVGVAAGQDFYQATLNPGQVYLLSSFSMAGAALGSVGVLGPADVTEQGDIATLKAAAQAACAAHLCKVMQRKVPRMFRTYSFMETIEVDWRQEEAAYFEDSQYHMGLVTGYVAGLQVPVAAMAAHPSARPNDPQYRTGSDPLAIPGAFGTYPGR